MEYVSVFVVGGGGDGAIWVAEIQIEASVRKRFPDHVYSNSVLIVFGLSVLLRVFAAQANSNKNPKYTHRERQRDIRNCLPFLSHRMCCFRATMTMSMCLYIGMHEDAGNNVGSNIYKLTSSLVFFRLFRSIMSDVWWSFHFYSVLWCVVFAFVCTSERLKRQHIQSHTLTHIDKGWTTTTLSVLRILFYTRLL